MNISEYVQYDALGLAELVSNGDVTPDELQSLARAATESVNDSLNAVVAYVDDHQGPEQDDPAVFNGVPTFMKDIGASIAGVPQEMGSRLTAGHTAGVTTHFASQMIRSGLNIIGRSTCPEFGLTLTTESAAQGRTCNPWNPRHIAGGSSGGAAALVAAGAVPLAHSNDGGGSTRIPAAICGNVGLKASRGRISLAPIVNDVTAPLIVEGCNSRTVRDTAAFLDVVSGPAPGEGTLYQHNTDSFLEGLKQAPGTYKIAVSLDDWGLTPMDTEIRSEVERIAESLREMGHQVEITTPEIARGGAITECFETLWYALANATVNDLAPLTNRQPGPDNLEPTTLAMVEAGSKISAYEFNEAMGFSNVVGRQLGEFFTNWDLLLTPTMNQATPELNSHVTLSSPGSLKEWFDAALAVVPHTPIANFSGVPAISVPCATGPGDLPLGMHFLAPIGGEARLLDIARQLEEAEPWIQNRPAVFAS